MKLLVLAQVPPPVHGQSLMVRTLVAGLPAHGIGLEHVNLRLSRDSADIGGWRPGKIPAVLDACLHALVARFTRGCDTLYYVPAPGKRGALYRDWVVLLLCRPFFKHLVLHWHATGLAAWLATQATAPERWLTQRLLGRADLSLVLASTLDADARALAARRVIVVANGITDPNPSGTARREAGEICEVLFLGLCCAEKGLFAAAHAVLAANARAGRRRFRLTAAGAFPDQATAEEFSALTQAQPETLRHAGFVTGAAKHDLLAGSDCLCLPTQLPHEGQPLVLLEAMAHDLPIIATRWSGIPATLPPEAILVEPGDADALTQALLQLRKKTPPAGVFRRHFLERFTAEKHLTTLAAAFTPG